MVSGILLAASLALGGPPDDPPFIPNDIRLETLTWVGLQSWRSEDRPDLYLMGVIRCQVMGVEHKTGRLVVQQYAPLKRTLRVKASRIVGPNPSGGNRVIDLDEVRRLLRRGLIMAEIRMPGGNRRPEVVMWVGNP